MKCTLPLAITFLTALPWRRLGEVGPRDLARSMLWFPWVGLLLGLMFWAGMFVFRLFKDPVAAALLLVLTVAATRGLHLDGLADTVDGLGGGKTPQERLAIMRDSRLGAFGAMSLFLALLLKFTLFLCYGGRTADLGLILFPVISRWGMVLLAFLSPYARPEGGLGEAMTSGVTGGTLAGATLGALFLAFLFFGIGGMALLAVAAAAVWLLSLYFRRKLGGVTGDVLGAANEVLEVLMLLGLLLTPAAPPVFSPRFF
jgi:adenosylcobinamide-GDP ribazoletransferase